MIKIEAGKTYKSNDGPNRKVLRFDGEMVEFLFEGKGDDEPGHLTEDHFRSVVIEIIEGPVPITGASLIEGEESFPPLSRKGT